MFFTLVTRSSKTRRGDPALEKSKPDGVNNIDENKPDEAKVAATKKLQSQRRKKPKKENFITKKFSSVSSLYYYRFCLNLELARKIGVFSPVATRTRSKTMTPTSESQEIRVQNDSKQSSSKAESAVEGSLPNVTVQPLLHAPKMWNNDSLLPAYFVTLEKYFEINNISDENMRFVCLSNVMSHSQAEAHGLALSRASGNIEPYTALKNLILSSVSLECNTDRIDVFSKIKYANAQEKPFTLMSCITACRNNPDNDQGTRNF